MMMRKLYFLTVAAAFFGLSASLTGCATSEAAKAEKQIRLDRTAQAVEDSLNAKSFTVEVNYISPQRMQPRALTAGYRVIVREGKEIDSYLPFFGQVFRPEFGEQTGLNFKDKIVHYQSGMTKKGHYVVELSVRRSMETLIYRFEIFDNGRVSLMVRSDNRDTMDYTGELVI